MRLFKKQITAEAAAICLVELLTSCAVQAEVNGAERIEKLAEGCNVDAARIRRELMYIRTFAVQFCIAEVLGETGCRDAVVQAFFSQLRNAAADAAGRGDESGRIFWQGVRNRIPGYENAAIKTAYEDPKGLSLGNLFAAFCGRQDDLMLSLSGFQEFSVMAQVTRSFLRSVKVVARA